MNISIRTLVVSATLVALPLFAHAQSADVAAAVATTAPSSCAAAPMRSVQKRIIAKAAEGVNALRQYLWTTRAIYSISMDEAVASIDRERARRADCVALAGAPVQP